MDSVLFCLQQIKSLSIHLFSPRAYRGLLFTQKQRGGGGGEAENTISLFPKEAPVFSFCSSLHSASVRRRWRGKDRSRLIGSEEVKSISEAGRLHYAACQPAAALACFFYFIFSAREAGVFTCIQLTRLESASECFWLLSSAAASQHFRMK